MLLVVDANILFSALVASHGTTRSLFFLPDFELVSPEFIETEVDKYFSELVIKSKCSDKDLKVALNLLFTRIKILPLEKYASLMDDAEKISPDPKDIEYFAVALSCRCPLWSNDRVLKLQNKVKVFSTSEVLELL